MEQEVLFTHMKLTDCTKASRNIYPTLGPSFDYGAGSNDDTLSAF